MPQQTWAALAKDRTGYLPLANEQAGNAVAIEPTAEALCHAVPIANTPHFAQRPGRRLRLHSEDTSGKGSDQGLPGDRRAGPS